MAKNIELFTTPTCPACQQAKNYLEEKGVEYVEYNVAENDEARTRMVEETGQMVVPITIIDGEHVVGFDRDELERLLA